MPELEDLVAEAERQFSICNACRYCEEYCPVFPAMSSRDSFTAGDLSYLANVCHDCRACYQACMYTDPHEFAINIPALMSESRVLALKRYSRPRWLARAFDRGGVTLALVTLCAIVLIAGLYAAIGSVATLTRATAKPGNFYSDVSHTALIVPALLLTAFGTIVVGLGVVSFWRDARGNVRDLSSRHLRRTLIDAATLRWLRGAGADCFYPDPDHANPARRRLHHLVAYGFLSALAATVTAWIAETFLGDPPPYGIFTIPVILGTLGGVGIILGTIGLLILKTRQPATLAAHAATQLDISFLIALLTTATTGVALLILRDTALIAPILLLHLATILALYLTAPYGKFMHAAYRTAALARASYELSSSHFPQPTQSEQ